MRILFRWVSLRHLAGEWPRTALTVLGVALGVGVLVAVRLANQSALGSFSQTVDAVAGRANLEVRGAGEGFDERLWTTLRRAPGVRAAAPRVEVHALARAGGPAPLAALDAGEASPYRETILVLGVDPFAERAFLPAVDLPGDRDGALRMATDPRAAAVSRAFATRNDLAVGDSLTALSSGVPVVLTVAAILESPELQRAFGGNLVFMDVAAAQESFGRLGLLDAVPLQVAPRDRDAVAESLRSRLPAGLAVEAPQGRTRQVENMVQAFQLNLTALSFIALFVAAFMIHNAVSLAALRRRAEIGVLRSLGATRGQVRALFLAEGAMLGLVGGLLGLALGVTLARGMLGAISRTLTDLYLVAQTRDLRADPVTLAVGLALALAASIAASLLPAREAATTPPAMTMRQGVWRDPGRMRIGRWTLAGVAVLALAAVVAWWTLRERIAVGGFACAFLVLAGFTLLAPGFTLLVEVALGPAVRRTFGIAGSLGARFLREAVSRTSVVVAALMVSVAMLVALTVMVGSFRRTVDLWVSQSIRGDLYVEPAGHRLNAAATELPLTLVEAVRAIPGVAAVDTYRGARIVHGGRPALAAGVDFDVQARFGRLQFVRGEAGEILGRARAEGGAIVTESFASHHRVSAGDTVAVATPGGLAPLRVAGVFYDYSTDAGGILMDASRYAELWGRDRVESLALYLRPGADREAVRREVVARAGADRVLYVMPNQSLRAQVLRVFDQTFRITSALQAIAVLVAVLGLVTTLTTLILQRGREIGVLRAAGTLRSQVRTMVLVESGMLGLIGTLLGCACGVVLALLLVHVINRQFFGWTIRLDVDPWVFAQTLALLVGTALAAGLIPARVAARRQPAEALRMD